MGGCGAYVSVFVCEMYDILFCKDGRAGLPTATCQAEQFHDPGGSLCIKGLRRAMPQRAGTAHRPMNDERPLGLWMGVGDGDTRHHSYQTLVVDTMRQKCASIWSPARTSTGVCAAACEPRKRSNGYSACGTLARTEHLREAGRRWGTN